MTERPWVNGTVTLIALSKATYAEKFAQYFLLSTLIAVVSPTRVCAGHYCRGPADDSAAREGRVSMAFFVCF